MKLKLFVLSSLIALTACEEQSSDLQVWMQQTRTEAKAKVKPIEKPTPVQPVSYFAPPHEGPNAFNSKRMRAAYQSNAIPDINRPKELLENYSLENLKYAGYIGSKNALSAIIEADGHVYTVKIGAHLGQNFGKLMAITPGALKIVEIVEDASGNWNSRDAELLLDGSISTQ